MPENAGPGTILVADDEPIVLNLAVAILRRHGFKVLTATDGPTALRLFKEEPVDLVLTDVVMPRMSGPQLMHCIHEENRAVRCIFMSGYSADQLREYDAGDPGCDYLRKPFTPDALMSLIRRRLGA